MKTKLFICLISLSILFLLLLPKTEKTLAATAITKDNSNATYTISPVPTVTFNLKVANHPNTILIVSAVIGDPTSAISSITYNAKQSLTKLSAISGDVSRTEIWYLVNPKPGNNSIQIALSSPAAIAAGAMSYYNIDPSNPFSNVTINSQSQGVTGIISVTIPSKPDQLVIDSWGYSSDDSATVGPGQTIVWKEQIAGITHPSGFSSSQQGGTNGGTSTTMSWTNNGPCDDGPCPDQDPFTDIGVALNPLPNYTISGNIFIDALGNGKYLGNNPPDTLNTTPTSLTITDNKTGKTVATLNNITGSYNTSLPGGKYTVIFNGPPAGYYMSYPLTGTPPEFIVALGPGCNVNTNDASCSGGNITNLNFGMNNAPAWYQNVCGDVRIDNGIIDKIPAAPSCGSSSGPYAIQTVPACTNSPGVAFTGDTSADFGQGQASTNPYNYLAGGISNPEVYKTTHGIIHTSYTYLSDRAKQSGLTPTDLSSAAMGCKTGTLNPCKLKNNLPHGIYQANSDLHLQNYHFTGNQNFVFLINGDLYLEGNITIDPGSTVTFAVTGNVIVPPSVGNINASDATPNIEGFYTTDQSFIVNGTPNICSSNNADLRLNISGSIITNAGHSGGSFVNNRTLCGENAACPVVSISERPDFFLFAPQFIRVTQHLWQEVAP